MRIQRPQTLTTDVYDAVASRLNLEINHPLGLISHAAGEVDGTLHIVEIWDSEDVAEQFDREHLVPAIEAVTGSPPPGDSLFVSFELRGLVTP